MTWDKGDPRTTSPAWRRLRLKILKRDGWACYLCGRRAAEVDHRISHRQGGTDDPSNLAAVCLDCHKAKSAREGAAARWRHHPTHRPAPKHPGLL